MDTYEYMDDFFPFQKLDFRRKGTEYTWNETEKMMIAVTEVCELECLDLGC